MSSRPWCDAGLTARGVLLAALALGVAGAVPAAPPSSGALATLDAQRQAREMARDADRARAEVASAAVAKLQAELVALGRQETAGLKTAGGARAALDRLALQEAELKARMGRNQESLTKLLGALQMFARDPPPALLVDPRSARDAVRATLLIKAITPELEARAQGFTQASAALKRVRREADMQSGVLSEAEGGVAEREARIADLIVQKEALERQFHQDADLAQSEAQRLAARARSLGELVTAVDGRSQDGGASGAPIRLSPPVEGPMVAGFGQPGSDPEHARGLTWTAQANASVLSPAAAVVDYAGPLKGWGQVLILHAGDTRLVLAGLSAVSTEAGRSVEAGEPIGRLPADTPHPRLYLEVRRAGRPVDPTRWLGAAATTGA